MKTVDCPVRSVLIIWEWAHVIEDVNNDTGSSHDHGSDNDSSSDYDEHAPSPTTSSVLFKCIGVTRDPMYQSIQSDVRDKMQTGTIIPVKFLPETNNPYDPNAIAFQCWHKNQWSTIGYVVAEICTEVQAAIDNNDIVHVEFSWVKYKLWKKNAGFYAAIKVTRKGQWSQKVIKAKSTFS